MGRTDDDPQHIDEDAYFEFLSYDATRDRCWISSVALCIKVESTSVQQQLLLHVMPLDSSHPSALILPVISGLYLNFASDILADTSS